MCDKNEIISVIVPVYNMEHYLDRCLESITKQTYRQLEIIVVDDGSTDTSPTLCDLWAERDERIKVIHQTNSGVAVARDTGIAAAGGEYLAFVDSDDWLEEDMYEYLYKLINSGNYQIASCSYINTDGNASIENPPESLKSYGYVDIVKNMGPDSLWAIWNKLFRKAVFDNIPTDLPTLSFGEDQMLLSFVYKNVDGMILSNQKKYNYFKNSTSASHIKLNSKRVSDVLASYEVMRSHFDNNSPAYIHFLANYVVFNIAYLNRIIKSDCCWEFYDTIKQNILSNSSVVFNRELSYIVKAKHKIAVILLKISPRLYNRLMPIITK